MKFKRTISLFLVAIMLFTTNAFALYNSENNIIAKKTVHTVSPGLEFTSSVEICDGVRQEIYSFKYLPGNGTAIVPAYGEYIYGFNSVGQLISSYDGEGRVVGGINTDFFITSTGIPLSCLISDGEIISSCDNRPALGFDADGNAVIGYPKISASFVSDERELGVAHINKTPAVWGMYLVTDEFSSTTQSSLESIEIVFRPFIKKSSEEDEIETDAFNKQVTEILTTSDEIDEATAAINEGESTDVQEKTFENTPNEEASFNFENRIFTDENIVAGKDIDVIVTEIRDSSMNSEIPKDSFVLCIPKEQFGYLTDGIKIGDEFVLKAQIDDTFSECTNIFGAGSIILENGEFVEQTSDSIYKYRNPRTAAGILADGSVVFVAVDGRRAGKSEGFTINELSDYLKDMGCVSAVNFDGGGSTTFYAADIGEIYSGLKNTPSDGSERRVADGLIFVNTTEPTQNIKYGAIYPGEYFVYNIGTSIDISGTLLFADENLHPLITNKENFALSVDKNFGDTIENIFYPNGTVGKAPITAFNNLGDMQEMYDVGYVNIIDSVNKINFNVSDTELTPFEIGSYLDVKAFLNTIPINISPDSVEWKIYIEYIDENGENALALTPSDYAYINFETMEFVPVKRGYNYVISAEIGGMSHQIKIFADIMPYADMGNHWAGETAYEMYKLGYITGEVTGDGIKVFVPDRNMTKAEFCAVLARILELESYYEQDISENFKNDEISDEVITVNDGSSVYFEENYNNESESEIFDVDNLEEGKNSESVESMPIYNLQDVPEWAKDYVNSLYTNGYLSELIKYDENGNLTIEAEEYITRAEIIKVLASLLNYTLNNNYTDILNGFTDCVVKDEHEAMLFATAIENGLIKGYEDGTIRQHLNLTRAEAATVFSRFYSIFKE